MRDEEYDKPARTDEEIFKECAARLKIAEEAESENRADGLADRKFRYGEQWPDDITSRRKLEARPALTINHTDTFCRRIENNLRQQRPRIKAHPVDSGSDVQTAETVNGLIRHIEAMSQASVAYDTAGSSAIDMGWGYCRVLAEYVSADSFDQELKIVPVRNTLTGYIDPAAVLPDGSDARWFIFTEKMSREKFKQIYPRQELKPFEQASSDAYDWENKEEIRLAEYYRIAEKPEKLYRMSDGSAVFESELPSEESMRQAGIDYLRDAKDQPIYRMSARRSVEWYRLNGTKVVDRRLIPGKYIPVARCEGNALDVNGKVKRFGMVRNLRSPAQMFNYWRTAQTERYALSPKAPWVAAEGQLEGHPEWDDANRRPYSVLKYKPVVGPDGGLIPPPQRQPPVQVEAGMDQAALGAERDLLAVAGMPAETDQSRLISGNKYLARRQAASDLTHFQYYDNQTLMIAHVGRILLEQIPYYYDTPRMQRIIGADGTPSVVGLNQREENEGIIKVKNDLTVGRYDVVMDTGPGYQTKREEGAEMMMNLLGTPLGEVVVKMGADLVVRNMDFAGAEDLADRLAPSTPEGMQKAMESMPQQAKSVVAGLMQQLQEAQQLIQRQNLEIKFKKDIEDGWMNVEREKTHIQAKTKVHDTETKAQTALGVAEIHGAAQLLNTNTEAAHDRRAAQDMIDAGQKAADKAA